MAGKMGNPAPLGLFAFGGTTAMLMYIEMGWVEHDFKSFLYGYALFLGGLCQLIVGIFELIHGSSFSFAVFGSYGAYWMAKAAIWVETANVNSAFAGGYPKGLCAFFIQWGLLTAVFWIFTFRKNVALVIVFGLLDSTFFLLAAAEGSGNATVKKVAGYVGFLTALSAFYTGIAELVNEEWGWHVLPGLKPLLTLSDVNAASLSKRFTYDKDANTLLLHMCGLNITSSTDVLAIKDSIEMVIKSCEAPSGKVHVVANYRDVSIPDSLIGEYKAMVADLQRNYYLSVRRFQSTAFGGKAQDASLSTTAVDKLPRGTVVNPEDVIEHVRSI